MRSKKPQMRIYVWVCEAHKNMVENPTSIDWMHINKARNFCNIAGCKNKPKYDAEIVLSLPVSITTDL